MSSPKTEIAVSTVVMLVLLRLSIGCHFLYEGVWKIQHCDQFSAEPFLTQAKGPVAELFYAMVPNIDGRETLRVVRAQDGSQQVQAPQVTQEWRALHSKIVQSYELSRQQKLSVDTLLKRYQTSLKRYLALHADEIVGYFDSLRRLESDKSGPPAGTPHEKKRLWDRQQALRSEVKIWLTEINGMTDDLRLALRDLLNEDQRSRGMPPVGWRRIDVMNMAVTYGLTAIGLCLVLGLFTRLACVGGAAFLVSVLLTQPPWPTIYPPAPAVVGHALLVDKNFVEMVALLLMATTAVGQWGGLDLLVRRLFDRLSFSRDTDPREE